MTIQEKIRQIVSSQELSSSEKLDRLHSLIPMEVYEIDSLSTATPAQARLLSDGLAVTSAMQEIRRADFLARAAKRERNETRGDGKARGRQRHKAK